LSILPLTVPPKRLAQTISSTATSFKLNNIQSWQGVDLVPGDFGTEAFAVLINLTRTQIEIIEIDPATIGDASITIVERGLDYLGGETPDLSRQYAWASNETIVQLGTDAPQLFRDFMSESNPATVTALHTYDVLPQSAVVPTDPDDFANKSYVDGLTAPAISVPINQVAHGFVAGDVIRISGVNTYAKAQADSPVNAEVVGIVTEVTDVDNFVYITEGIVSDGTPVFAAGSVLFLSRTTAGELVDTDTTTIGEVSFPLAVVSESGLKMIFHKYRPLVINSISGNPVASETVAGMVEQATPAQVAAGTDTGETGAPLFVVPSLIPAIPGLIGAKIEQNAASSFGSSNFNKQAYQVTDFDTDSIADLPNNQLVITTTGTYFIGGAGYIISERDMGLQIQVNATVYLENGISSFSEPQGCTISGIFQLTAGDTIEMYGASSGAENSSGDFKNNLWAYKIG